MMGDEAKDINCMRSTSRYFVDHRDYIAIGETKQKFVVSSSLHSDTWF